MKFLLFLLNVDANQKLTFLQQFTISIFNLYSFNSNYIISLYYNLQKSIDQFQLLLTFTISIIQTYSVCGHSEILQGNQINSPQFESISNMYNLLSILQTIILSYSHLPINDLFQNHLSLNIFILSQIHIVKDLFKNHLKNINKAKSQIFIKGANLPKIRNSQSMLRSQHKNITNQKCVFLYLTVNHHKMLPLHKKILIKSQFKQSNQFYSSFVQNVICLTTNNQILDNLFEIEPKSLKDFNQHLIKGFILKVPIEQNFTQQLIHQVDLFLSITQFFHSHVGLALSIHQISEYQQLERLIELSQKQFQQDDDQMLINSIFCRIFSALPFKMTYNEIATLADIQTHYWGETIRIDQGTDGIIFWFVCNHSPILMDQNALITSQKLQCKLKASSTQKNYAEKHGLRITQQQYAHIVLKSKLLLKQSLQNLNFTIVIMNIKRQQYSLSLNKFFSQIFEKEVKIYSQNRLKVRQFQICQKVSNQIDRLSQLLAEVQENPFETDDPKVIEEIKKQQSQELAYNIKRRLFIKGSL